MPCPVPPGGLDARDAVAGPHETPVDMSSCLTGTYTLYVYVDDVVLSLNVVKK